MCPLCGEPIEPGEPVLPIGWEVHHESCVGYELNGWSHTPDGWEP